jgi:hypothetical protein
MAEPKRHMDVPKERVLESPAPSAAYSETKSAGTRSKIPDSTIR